MRRGTCRRRRQIMYLRPVVCISLRIRFRYFTLSMVQMRLTRKNAHRRPWGSCSSASSPSTCRLGCQTGCACRRSATSDTLTWSNHLLVVVDCRTDLLVAHVMSHELYLFSPMIGRSGCLPSIHESGMELAISLASALARHRTSSAAHCSSSSTYCNSGRLD